MLIQAALCPLNAIDAKTGMGGWQPYRDFLGPFLEALQAKPSDAEGGTGPLGRYQAAWGLDWCGRGESNSRGQFGKLKFYH